MIVQVRKYLLGLLRCASTFVRLSSIVFPRLVFVLTAHTYPLTYHGPRRRRLRRHRHSDQTFWASHFSRLLTTRATSSIASKNKPYFWCTLALNTWTPNAKRTSHRADRFDSFTHCAKTFRASTDQGRRGAQHTQQLSCLSSLIQTPCTAAMTTRMARMICTATTTSLLLVSDWVEVVMHTHLAE